MTTIEREELVCIRMALYALAKRVEELLDPPRYVPCTKCGETKHQMSARFCGCCGTRLPGGD